jgi:7-carboxy-7-deazaguanine synthase
MSTPMIVSEIFESFQGEGPNTGMFSIFLRLGGCNLHCVWCDTPYTWHFTGTHSHKDPTIYSKTSELKTLQIEDVIASLLASDAPNVVITGGEPMLQQRALTSVIQTLIDNDKSVEIETAGTVMPEFPVSLYECLYFTFNVSPKLANSGNTVEERYQLDVLRRLAEVPSIFKFVVAGEEELEEVDAMVASIGLASAWVWIQPEAIKEEQLVFRMKQLAPAVLARGYNLGTRLQILAFGNKRGT